MERRVAGLGLGVALGPAVHQQPRHADLVLLGAQVDRGQPVLGLGVHIGSLGIEL